MKKLALQSEIPGSLRLEIWGTTDCDFYLVAAVANFVLHP